MPDHACSLINKNALSVPRNTYWSVPFPYTDITGESADAEAMHNEMQGGVSYPYPHQNSALIWPAHDAWAQVVACFQFEAGDYTEIRSRICRDPFGAEPDWTATDHHALSPGMQCFTKNWGMHLKVGTPLALQVHHNASTVVDLVLAEFKVIYRTDPVVPEPAPSVCCCCQRPLEAVA